MNHKIIVGRLIAQYKEYEVLQGVLSGFKKQRVLGQDVDQRVEAFYKTLLQQTADEMTFATPGIWILYKALAYKNSPQALETVDDFRAHCQPEGYICTKRYKMLRTYLEQKSLSLQEVSGRTPLETLANQPLIIDLESDGAFLEQWQRYEYFKKGDKIAKWQNFR